MRPLTDEELKIFFEKLASYIGRNIKHLVNEEYVFRLHKDRVYYLSEELLRMSAPVARGDLVSIGVLFGKFSRSLKFQLHMTALPYLAKYAKYKVWMKPSAEMGFLYGNHVLKAGLGRITENTPQYQGVVVFNMADVALGFGVTARSTQDCRRCDPSEIVAFHQADVGEYLRHEQTMF